MSTARWLILALALLSSACVGHYRVWYGHSPDRMHRVEVIEKRGHQQLRVDDEPPRRYLGVGLETILFSEDSSRLAYAAEIDAGWVVVVDGVASRPWTGIGEILFGPDHRLAYIAEDAGRWRVVLEGTLSPSFEAVMQGSLTFSPDGRRLAFVMAEGDGFRVVVDGEPGPFYQAIGALRFDQESKRLAYVVQREGQQYLALNGRLLGPFLLLADYTLGPEGRLGMLVRRDEGWRAVVDGQESEAFDNLGTIHFSQDGRHAYTAQRGGHWFVVLEGTPSPAYTSVEQLVFTRDLLVYQACLGKDAFVVVDGTHGPPLKRVGRLALSPDGAHLAYLGLPWGGSLSVFHDGAVYAVPYALDGSLVLSDDGRRWACLVLKEEGDIDVVIDGELRLPFDLEEMTARVMLTSDAPSARHEKMLRRWVKAELDTSGRSGP